MKKKIFGWVITVLMLAATHAAFAYAFYSGLMWWWGAVDYDSSATDIFVALTGFWRHLLQYAP